MATENNHSEYSPSAAKRWLACPSSIALTRAMDEADRLPPQVTTEAAKLGTEAHLLAQIALAAGTVGPYEDEEMRGYVKAYVDYVFSVVPTEQRHKLHIEERVNIFDGWGVWGTADCWYYDEAQILHVFDFKSGRRPVSANNNPQLMLYALGIGKSLDFPPAHVITHIVQPRVEEEISKAEYAWFELENFGKYVLRRLDLSNDYNSFRPSESSCHYCPVRSLCRARNEQLSADILKQFDIADLPDDMLVDFGRNKAKIEKQLEDIEKYLVSRLLDGDQIHGIELTQKRTRRRFTPEGEAKLDELYGDRAFVISRKPKSFVNLEAFGVPSELIEDLTFKPQGAPAIKYSKKDG